MKYCVIMCYEEPPFDPLVTHPVVIAVARAKPVADAFVTALNAELSFMGVTTAASNNIKSKVVNVVGLPVPGSLLDSVSGYYEIHTP